MKLQLGLNKNSIFTLRKKCPKRSLDSFVILVK